jgi:F-type H+-transporting ATPase subunit b
MILLSNSLTTPAIGTLVWSALIFGLFFLILTKFAWKPILNAVKARDEMIKGSLESAAKAREEMLKLQSDNEAILKKAREEREGILKEARRVHTIAAFRRPSAHGSVQPKIQPIDVQVHH